MLPHLICRLLADPQLFKTHFWLVVVGFSIYFVSLTTAGILQGTALMDPGSSFAEITKTMVPYLEGRSIGGTLMTLGHFVFAAHFALLLLQKEGRSKAVDRSEEHTSELQSLMRTSYAVFCLNKNKNY